MAQTLQNQILYAKSMNGIVSLSDGQGTTITNGTVNTNNFVTDTMTATNMVVPRINPNLTGTLGTQINLTQLSQNLNWDNLNKFWEIWNYSGSKRLIQVDTSNNIINIDSNTTFKDNLTIILEGNVVINLQGYGTDISTEELSFLNGLTDNIQTQFNNLPAEYVSRTISQSITGTKTFNGDVILNGITTVNNDLFVGVSPNHKYLEIYGRESIIGNSSPFLTIANYAFDTPVRSLNTGATVASPYTAITGWTFTLLSGSLPNTVATGRGFWDSNPAGPNSLVFYYPGYPTVNQCIGIRQDTASSFRLSQTVNIATMGVYLVSFWIWGRYNNYSTTQTVASSFGSNSVSGIQASEQYWKKVQYHTFFLAGNQTLSITFNQTASVASAICLTNIKTQFINGLSVADNFGYTADSGFLTPYGLTTNSIYNNGQLWNYGDLTVYGALAPFLPLVKNSAVIGDCKYGSAGTTSSGQHNYIFGFGVGTNIKQGGSAGTLNQVIAIGSGALEQATTATDCVAISRFAHRYAGSDRSICIGTQSGEYFGYSNRTNMSDNIAIGHSSMAAIFSTGNQYNIAIGNSAMRTSGDFTNSRAFNVAIGHSAGYSIASNNNTIVGYQACNNMLNTTSSENSFFGNQSGTTQTGASNVLQRCTFLGASSDVNSAGSYSNSTAIGYNAKISNSNQIVLGGSNGGVFPNVFLPNKNTLRAVHTVGAVASFNILFGMSENIDINSTTTTTINLPTPASENVGTKWTLYKKYTNAININIIAPASQTILSDKQAVATYAFGTNQNYLTIVCVGSTAGGTNYIAEGNGNDLQVNSNSTITGVYTFNTNPVFNTGAIPSSAVVFNAGSIPNTAVQGFDDVLLRITNISYDDVYDESFISSTVTRFKDIGSYIIGNKIGFVDPVNFTTDVFLYGDRWKLNGFTELSGSPNVLTFPLSRIYILTTSSDGAVQLPAISSDIYGLEITFIKVSATNTYTINRTGTDTFRFMGSNGAATATSITLQGRNTILKLVAQQSTVWSVIIDNYEGTEAPLITANYTIPHPFYESYSIATPNTTAITITLPAADITTEGLRFTFRRTNTTMAPVNSASANIRPINNGALISTILTNTQYLCEIGVFKTGASSYNWFLLRTA
jgi:hypothetical protein